MRRALAAFALVFLCWQACAMNWRITTRADHDTLDVVMRRLDYSIARAEGENKKNLIAIREHLTPVFTRHGGPVKWWEGGKIKIGSEDELDLICTQHGYANTNTDRAERRKDIAIGFFRWIRNSIWAIIMGMGPWVIAVLAIVLILRNRNKVIDAMFTDAEKLDKGKRKEVFTSPVVKKHYEKKHKK